MSDAVSLQLENGIARITLSKPAKRNALDEAMWTALGEAIGAAAAQRPRALIVTGTDGHFAAGMDPLAREPDPGSASRPRSSRRRRAAATSVITWLKGIVAGLAEFPAPTIAAIEGACAGSGFEIASPLRHPRRRAERILLAARGSHRHGPRRRRTTRLTRLVGPGRARD
jgi:2-(1,2-epoxy-1,2-dihydrophenyl)acetyl-CoA isomerase